MLSETHLASWLLNTFFIFPGSLWQFIHIWGFQLFQALAVHICPKPGTSFLLFKWLQTSCYWILQIIWVSATLPANTWGLYGRVICSQLYQRTLLPITSFLWPTWRFTKHKDLAAVTQVSPNFLSFRFLGTVLLWKLSEVCFSLCAKTNYQCLLRFKFPFPLKIMSTSVFLYQDLWLLSINYTRTNLLMLYQEFFMKNLFLLSTHAESNHTYKVKIRNLSKH